MPLRCKLAGLIFFASTALFAVVSDYVKHPERFQTEMGPKIKQQVDSFDPQLESKISKLESVLRQAVPVKPFALRGISTAGVGDCARKLLARDAQGEQRKTLEQWLEAGYLSEGGGNFFVYNPALNSYPPNEFLTRLYASVYAALGYGFGDIHPVVLLIDMDQNFLIPPSGGNDGISGSYPSIINVGGTEYLLHNLDVGAITKPNQVRKTGLVAERVPEERVRLRVGEGGLPEGLSIGTDFEDRWNYSEQKKMILSRWYYAHILEAIVSR